MKTTNYENSKKLAEIGFKADFEYCYSKDGEEAGKWNKTYEIDVWDEYENDKYYPSYDLETILDALPDWISDKYGNRHDFEMGKEDMCYANYPYDARIVEIEVRKEKDESLADTAARLLILLAEKEIIKL